MATRIPRLGVVWDVLGVDTRIAVDIFPGEVLPCGLPPRPCALCNLLNPSPKFRPCRVRLGDRKVEPGREHSLAVLVGFLLVGFLVDHRLAVHRITGDDAPYGC